MFIHSLVHSLCTVYVYYANYHTNYLESKDQVVFPQRLTFH